MRNVYAFIGKFGRKYSLAVFAGVSSLVITSIGLWIAARTQPATAAIVERIVSGYLMAAAGMVTAYAASNSYVEATHAKAGSAQAKAPPSAFARASGTIPEPEGH